MDKEGKLTEEDKGKVAAWLNERWPGDRQPCPICGDPTWLIADHLVMPLTLGPGNAVNVGGVGYPHIMLISLKCGYTRFLNAAVTGINFGEEKPAAPKPEEPKPEEPKIKGA